jgi:hypothetical protein
MTKTYKFKSANNNSFPFYKSNDYSKTIDDIILSDIIKKNSYLIDYDYKPSTTYYATLKDSDEFTKAANFLANYKKNKIKKFIYGKLYKLSDGTPIVFYEDEIQIGFDFYKYSDFNDSFFIDSLTPSKKKTIITIYGDADITINLK